MNNEKGTEELFMLGPLDEGKSVMTFFIILIEITSGYTKIYPVKRISIDLIINLIEIKHFPIEGVPKEIRTTNILYNEGKWKQFLNKYSCKSRLRTSDNNTARIESRIIQEICKTIELGKFQNATKWTIRNYEILLNTTIRYETGYMPLELKRYRNHHLPMDQRLIYKENINESWFEKIKRSQTNIEKWNKDVWLEKNRETNNGTELDDTEKRSTGSRHDKPRTLRKKGEKDIDLHKLI